MRRTGLIPWFSLAFTLGDSGARLVPAAYMRFAVGALALLISSCNGHNSNLERSSAPVNQELQITLGGSIEGHPEEGKLGGTCSATDFTRSEMSCDLYNGLSNWNLTQATVIVTWFPYRPDNERVYRIPVAIPSLTAQRFTFKLGFRLPPDTVFPGSYSTLKLARYGNMALLWY